MKKSFSLVEVLISVALLSIVIGIMIQIKQNNIFYLDKFTNSNNQNQYLSIATLDKFQEQKLRNTHIYLNDIVDFKDDDAHKILKDIKVNIKDTKYDTTTLGDKESNLKIDIYQTKYSIEDKSSVNIYRFTIQ